MTRFEEYPATIEVDRPIPTTTRAELEHGEEIQLVIGTETVRLDAISDDGKTLHITRFRPINDR